MYRFIPNPATGRLEFRPAKSFLTADCRRTRLRRWLAPVLCLFLLAGIFVVQAAPTRRENPEYLIARWLAGEGVLENSALGVAQTPEGYIWVASSGGLLRFNGREFKQA